jgi:ferrochelatase
MNLQNLTALVEGNLTNSPSITAFDDVSFEASKVRRGNLFVALKHEDIALAILNGAYGILFEKPTQITDQEIAWIKVASIDRALLRLLRFHIIEKSPQVFSCDQISLKLASQILTPNTLLVLDKPLREHIQELWKLEEKQFILFSPKLIDPSLFVDAKVISALQSSSMNIVEQTLFETSFIYDDTYYERQLLSPFFIPYLEGVLQFFKQNNIRYQLRNFTPIEHFQAVFTNIHFQVKEFGKSDKVLIFEPDFDLIKAQIKFLKQQANWAKLVYLIPASRRDELQESEDVFVYESAWDIMQLLKEKQYHFALIAEQTADILNSNVFDLRIKQPSLF